MRKSATGIIVLILLIGIACGAQYKIMQHKEAKQKIDVYQEDLYYKSRVNFFEIMKPEGKTAIFVGDSITDGCEWDELLSKYGTGGGAILNRGINSDTINGVKARMNTLPTSNSNVFFMIGINNLQRGQDLNKTVNDYTELAKAIKNYMPKNKVYMESVLPVNPALYKNSKLDNNKIVQLNSSIQKICEDYGFVYIDLYQHFVSNNVLNPSYTYDGLHLNGTGYKVFVENIYKYVY